MGKLFVLWMSIAAMLVAPHQARSQVDSQSQNISRSQYDYIQSRLTSLSKMENDLSLLQIQLEYSDLKLSNAVVGGVLMYGFIIPEVVVPTLKTLARSVSEARRAGVANEIHKTNYVLGAITLTLVTVLTASVTYTLYIETKNYAHLLTQIRLLREKIANEMTVLRTFSDSV